jgi:hypothetical protein
MVAAPPTIRTALTISRPQNCERKAPESVGTLSLPVGTHSGCSDSRRISDRKIEARFPGRLSRTRVRRGMIEDYYDFPMDSDFRAVGQSPTRAAIVAANWRGSTFEKAAHTASHSARTPPERHAPATIENRVRPSERSARANRARRALRFKLLARTNCLLAPRQNRLRSRANLRSRSRSAVNGYAVSVKAEPVEET